MSSTSNPRERTEIVIRPDHATVFVSLELSRSRWLITSMAAPRDKLSKHPVDAGDGAALLDRLARLRTRAEQRLGTAARVVVIQEAGLDGFWIHRLLEAGGIESHVVEPASIAVPRRHRRAKTDAIDGEMLVRTLAAFKRGEPRVCSMVVAPSPEEEDRRRISRERRTLIKERIEHANRIKGLLASQGIAGCEPMRRGFRDRLGSLRTGDGRPLGPRLKAEIGRELDRMDLVLHQIAAVEADRDALVRPDHADAEAPAARLIKLRGIGPEFAAVLWLEGLFRRFANRRQLAAYAGLAPSPWQSGRVDREQGIAKSGNPRLRTAMVELAWLWLRHQPDSALSRWFRERVGSERGRVRRVAIVALARKLLAALWRYTTLGELPVGATLKTA
jgi:transposase